MGNRLEDPTSFRAYTLKGTDAVIKYINSNVEENITIEALALRNELSPSALKRCFKAKTGFSIHTYIRKAKMKQAVRLLRITEMSITDIAYKLGYVNSSKFSSAFLSVMGEKPSDYRSRVTKRQPF